MANVEQIIQPFLEKVPSKAAIDAAEKAFDSAKQEAPAALVEQLFFTAVKGDIPLAAREQSVVLLRKCLERAIIDESSVWKRLGDSGQKVVRDKLLQLLPAETVGTVRRKIADCIQALGGQIINIDSDAKPWPNNIEGWPELMPTIMGIIMDTGRDAELRGDCLHIIVKLTFEIWPVMLVNATQTGAVLTACFQDAALPVCGNAVALYLELVENIDSKENRNQLAPMIPEMIKVLPRIASGDSTVLKTVLTNLGSECEVPKFLSSVMCSTMMPYLCGLALQHADEDCRKLALEAIINALYADPMGTVSNADLVKQALEVCTRFIMDNLDDDLEEWAGMPDDDDWDSEELHRLGRDNLDRICKAAVSAGEGDDNDQDRKYIDLVLELLKPALGQLFATGEWKSTVTGLTMFQQIGEYFDDDATVKQVVAAIQPQLKATHARVRHSAWSCITQFAEDHIEILSAEPFVGQLMTSFTEGLDDPVDRVCCRCMEAFQHYGENVEREDMESFVKPMMTKLATKLKGSPELQRKAITSVAVIAGQVEDAFAEYYGDLMPYLKGIISETVHKVEERTLLGKCFECISLLAKAVGRNGFRQDAESIMEAMIKATQVPNLPSSDPVKEYMMAASSRICSVLKEDFVPMIPHVLPGILEKFTLAPKDFSDLNNGDLEEDAEVTLTMMKTPDGQTKFMLMSSSDLEDLQGALQAVHTFIEQLGAAYAPFVTDTAKALVPVFEFNVDEDIRELAFEVWGELCQCARKANNTTAVNELVMEFVKRVVPALKGDEALDAEALRTKAEGTASVLKSAGPGIFQGQEVGELCSVTLGAMMKSFERREEILREKAKLKSSGEDADGHDDQFEQEEKLRSSLEDITGALMEHHPDLLVACGLQPFWDLIANLKQSSHKEDRKMILFMACSFVHYLKERVVADWEKFMPIVLEDILAKDPRRRQPACYAISLAGAQPAFAAVAVDTASKLQQLITESRGRAKKKSEKLSQAAADNALSGLVAVLQTHSQLLGAKAPELWNVWLQGLPCQEDEEEGKKNHKLLLQFVMEERLEVLGQGASNFPKLLALLVDQYKGDMVDEETNKGIQQLVLKLGQAKLEQMASGLTEKQRKKLLRVHREASAGSSPQGGYPSA